LLSSSILLCVVGYEARRMLLRSAKVLADLGGAIIEEPKLAGIGGGSNGGRAGDVVIVVVGADGVDAAQIKEYDGGGREKMSSCSSSCGDNGILDLTEGNAWKRSSKKRSSYELPC
jgi:hypothetical protein